MRLARSLFDDDVHVAEGDPAALPLALFPEEEAQIGRAVEKRVREYAAARGLYRTLLPRVGLPESALLNDVDRAPRWPEGVAGTITHTAGYCAVALAPSAEGAGAVLGLGLDAEVEGPLKRNLWKSICTPEELAALEAMPEHDAALRAKLVFSAKECVYKAQYARTRTFLGFSAMRVEVDDAAATFRAVFAQRAGDVYAPGDVLEGRFVRTDTLVVTSVTIRR